MVVEKFYSVLHAIKNFFVLILLDVFIYFSTKNDDRWENGIFHVVKVTKFKVRAVSGTSVFTMA